jgi:hypothetical protein
MEFLFTLSGCETLVTYPESRSEKQRLNDLPTANWPVKGNVDVHWNKNMIPFIEADFDEDCAFALVVVHAHKQISNIDLKIVVIAQSHK